MPPASIFSNSFVNRAEGIYPTACTTPLSSRMSPKTISVPFLVPVRILAFLMSTGGVPGTKRSEAVREEGLYASLLPAGLWIDLHFRMSAEGTGWYGLIDFQNA